MAKDIHDVPLKALIINNNLFDKLAQLVNQCEGLDINSIGELSQILRCITEVIKDNSVGQQVINDGYLDRFMRSIAGYITYDLQFN